MSSVFPIRSEVETEDRAPRLVDLDDETADEVFDALAAATTRRMLSALHEQPRTASDLAAVTDTSVQNAQYHLRKLQEVGLVEAVDT
jgi:DNA-binding transcriptional ArsR family regulator